MSHGIYITNLSINNTISRNLIVDNKDFGVDIYSSNCTSINENNFIDNRFHAIFYYSFLNNWSENYWDNWFFRLPKPIIGMMYLDFIGKTIPWINFDWHPAKEPYDISP